MRYAKEFACWLRPKVADETEEGEWWTGFLQWVRTNQATVQGYANKYLLEYINSDDANYRRLVDQRGALKKWEIEVSQEQGFANENNPESCNEMTFCPSYCSYGTGV